MVELGFTQDPEGERKMNEARQTGTVVKCILLRCHKTRSLFAHVVPVKGIDEDHQVMGMVVAAVRWLGHTKVLLKSDNEPALLKVVTASLKVLRIEWPISRVRARSIRLLMIHRPMEEPR